MKVMNNFMYPLTAYPVHPIPEDKKTNEKLGRHSSCIRTYYIHCYTQFFLPLIPYIVFPVLVQALQCKKWRS